MRKLTAVAAAAALVAGLVAGLQAQSVHRGGALRVGLDADPPNLDPHRSTAAVDRQVFQSLFDKLVDTDETLQIVPDLATSWTVSADGRTVTLRLRQGVTFQDGTPFNAEAVRYNLDRMRDPKFPSARRLEISPIQQITVKDPATVVLTLARPYSPLLYVLTDRAGMMVSPAAAQREGLDFALHPIGTGPFAFVEKAPQDHVTLQRNPSYWGKGLPYLDRIVFRPVIDDNARVANLKSGDLDIVETVPLPQVKELAQASARPGAAFRLLQRGAFAWVAIRLNVTEPPFDNKLLREALDETIDREALAGVVLQGAAYPAYSFFPNGTPGYDPSWPIPARSVAKAREKEQAAGRPGGFEFTLLTTPGEQQLSVAQAVQSMAADAGIRIKIQAIEFGTLLDTLAHLRHQAGLLGWSGRPDPDGDIYSFLTQAGPDQPNNTGYVNPRVTSLLDASRLLGDMAQRRRAYREVLQIVADDMPYVWLYFPKEYKLVSVRVHGFVHVPDGMIRLAHAWLSP